MVYTSNAPTQIRHLLFEYSVKTTKPNCINKHGENETMYLWAIFVSEVVGTVLWLRPADTVRTLKYFWQMEVTHVGLFGFVCSKWNIAEHSCYTLNVSLLYIGLLVYAIKSFCWKMSHFSLL